MKELFLSSVKPNWCDLTDAGPGVGLRLYFEVRFRDAELSRIWDSDFIEHGKTYLSRFHDKSDEEIEKMIMVPWTLRTMNIKEWKEMHGEWHKT